MTRIRILPEAVANRIAAGEVVERPANFHGRLRLEDIEVNAMTAAASHISQWFWTGLALAGYLSLFVRTAWQNRKNRGIVLGALTVCVFFVFLWLGDFVNESTKPWVRISVVMFIALAGLSILLFVGLDIVRWANQKRFEDDGARSGKNLK